MSAHQNITSSTINTNTRLIVRTLAGTASTTANSPIVTGVGTTFTTDFKPGDDIIISAERKTVKRVTSNTLLEVMDNYSAALSALQAGYYPQEAKGYNKIITIISHASNAADLWVGESINLFKNGADISSTSRSFPISPLQPIGPVVVTDLYDVFVSSSVASQNFSVIINQ